MANSFLLGRDYTIVAPVRFRSESRSPTTSREILSGVERLLRRIGGRIETAVDERFLGTPLFTITSSTRRLPFSRGPGEPACHEDEIPRWNDPIECPLGRPVAAFILRCLPRSPKNGGGSNAERFPEF